MCQSVFHGKKRREFESLDCFEWHKLANLSFVTCLSMLEVQRNGIREGKVEGRSDGK